MAASICGTTTTTSSSSSSSSSSPILKTLLRPQKLSHNFNTNGVSVKNNYSTLPIRCRFNIPSRNSNFSLRRAGMITNLEPTTVGAPTSVPVRVAHELLQAGHRYLDVRTPEEFAAGRAPGAVNIPYMLRIASGMTKNPQFLEQVASQFRKDDEILLGCQSGKRSLMAANDLQSAGYTGIIDVAGGYAAWVQSEHPTEV